MTNPLLSRLRLVLVEPAGALNLGSIARAMKNMGLSQIVLVNPHCHPDDDDAKLMAVHAADVLQSARRVDTLPEALVGCHRALATTARERDIVDPPLEHPRTVLPWLLGLDAGMNASIESALIFGPEDRGLSNTELSYAQRGLRIPTSPVYPSLNLAQAVAICCYELYHLALHPQLAYHHARHEEALDEQAQPTAQNTNNQTIHIQQNTHIQPSALASDLTSDLVSDLASLDEVEGFYHHLEDVLLKIGYLYEHTSDSRMKKFRRLFNRADLTKTEVSMLRGILRQMAWAAHGSEDSHEKTED
jgi:tRNA/rRNA methyltransferase